MRQNSEFCLVTLAKGAFTVQDQANVEISISQVAAGEAAVAGGGASTGVSYSTGSVGTIITINGLNVPEPTTSTLSLLALAGFCARRRRK